MRGAPAKPSLAADFAGDGAAQRPQSAMAALRSAAKPDAFSRSSRPGSSAAARPQSAMVPASMNKNVMVSNFGKQLTREQWASRPIRQ